VHRILNNYIFELKNGKISLKIFINSGVINLEILTEMSWLTRMLEIIRRDRRRNTTSWQRLQHYWKIDKKKTTGLVMLQE